MKLISTFRERNSLNRTQTIISDNCTIAQAFDMIEKWCTDNNANMPRTCDIWKVKGIITVHIVTKDDKYLNIFDIID